MSCSAKMRKLSVRIDANLKAAFEDTLHMRLHYVPIEGRCAKCGKEVARPCS